MTAPSYRATLTTYLRPLRPRVVVLTLLMLGSIGLQLDGPTAPQPFHRRCRRPRGRLGMVAIGVAYLVAGIVNQVLDAGAVLPGSRHRLEGDQPAARGTRRAPSDPRHGFSQRDHAGRDDRTGRRRRYCHLRFHLPIPGATGWSRRASHRGARGVLARGLPNGYRHHDLRVRGPVTAGEPAEAGGEGRRGGTRGLCPPVRIHRRAAGGDRGHPGARAPGASRWRGSSR